MEVTGYSAAANDVLLRHTEVRGNGEGGGSGGSSRETQDTLYTQSLFQHLCKMCM